MNSPPYKFRVIVDERERASKVPEFLRELGVIVDFRMLEIGDYILPGYAIERKEIRDFLRSIFSKRIFDQAGRLREAYEEPILIVEGDVSSIIEGGINPSVLWGALAAITLDYELRIFFTPNPEQTANLIYTLGRRRPSEVTGPIVRGKPRIEDLRAMQIHIVASLPGIGPKLADRLLRRFKSVRRVFMATAAELSTVSGISRKASHRIKRILDASYSPPIKPAVQMKLNDDPKGLKV